MSSSRYNGRTVILAGCGRSGTTSIFQMLSESPEIDHSKRKATAFFMGAYYQNSPLDLEVYDQCFGTRPNANVRLEATHAYFYATPEVPQAILRLVDDPLIILIFREPYARLVSEFSYLKSRSLIDQDLAFEDFVDISLKTPQDAFRQGKSLFFGANKGLYNEYFPYWAELFGNSLKVLFFDDLQRDAQKLIRVLSDWIGVHPFQVQRQLEVVNHGMGFRVRSVQQLALAINNQFEPFFRRHPSFKLAMRKRYHTLNGVKPNPVIPLAAEHPIFDMYRSGMDAFRAQLLEWDPDIGLPRWLEDWL